MYICILQICVCVSYYVCELLMKRLSYLMLGFNVKIMNRMRWRIRFHANRRYFIFWFHSFVCWKTFFFFCLICVYLFWIWIKIICNRMIWCLKFLLNHQSSNCSVLFLERKKCFRHANRWKRVSFPLSLFLSCDNHFPYTCIEFNYKNISGKKGAESKLYSKLKLH